MRDITPPQVAAYLRGAFLAAGNVADPKKEYHLEWNVSRRMLARDLLTLLQETGIKAGLIARQHKYMVYVKESTQIEDCLTLMGSSGSSLELMDIKIYKELRNRANRVRNCETANIDKTVAASASQLEAIRLIRDTVGLDSLPEGLAELARLRLDNPEMSLSELRQALGGISRSGVNYRLKRIEAFAKELGT